MERKEKGARERREEVGERQKLSPVYPFMYHVLLLCYVQSSYLYKKATEEKGNVTIILALKYNNIHDTSLSKERGTRQCHVLYV